MPPQAGNVVKGLFGDSLKKHRNDETVAPGGGNLPPGIENGIAQLVEAKIDLHKDGDNKGKPFAFFSGVVTSVGATDPQVVGRRASKIIGLYPSVDGKKSKDDRVAELLNEMRLFGCDTSTFSDDEDVTAGLAALKEAAPLFGFRTWQSKPTPQYPNPRVNTTFLGAVEGDGTPAGTSDGGTVADSSGDASDDVAGDSGEASGGSEDWAALGEQADAGDTEAAEKLVEAGKQYGVNTDEAASWSEAASEIAAKEAGGGEAGEGDGEPAPWVPEVGQVFDYKPKGARKAIAIEITHVFSKTLNAKEVESGKVHKALAWTANPDTIGGQPIG